MDRLLGGTALVDLFSFFSFYLFIFFLFFIFMSGTSAFWTHLQSKPRYRVLYPQKFSYTELVKLLAFHPGCALRDCLNLGPP
jgi:hypothetical protein